MSYLKFWQGVRLVALLAVCAGFGVPHPARGDDRLDRLFTIQAVAVDVVARTSTAARSQAIAEAEKIGFEKLVAKLTQVEDQSRLPALDRNARLALISGIEVVEEQFSSRRYTAKLDVRFEPDLVSRFFADHGVPHVFSAGSGLMPFLSHQRGDAQVMWEPDPTVTQAMVAIDWLNRLRQYDFPTASLKDRLALTARQVAAFDVPAAEALARRYGDLGALLISTRWFGPIEGLAYEARLGRSGLKIEGRVRPDDPVFVGDNALAWGEAEGLRMAIEAVLDAVDHNWRRQLLVDVSQEGTLTFEVPSLSAKAWHDVRARIEGLSLVRGVRVISLGLPLSRVEIRYTGREEQLLVALREAGLVVEASGDAARLSLATP